MVQDKKPQRRQGEVKGATLYGEKGRKGERKEKYSGEKMKKKVTMKRETRWLDNWEQKKTEKDTIAKKCRWIIKRRIRQGLLL